MKHTHISIILFITIILFSMGGCKGKDQLTNLDEAIQETLQLKSGRFIYGDTLSLTDSETITINTDDNLITYSSSPISSYLTYGEYSNSEGNSYTFTDEKGIKHSFTIEENSINYNNKRFVYYNDENQATQKLTDNIPNKSVADNKYNQFDKCTMEIVEGTITAAGLTVRLKSTNENETFYGSYYRIEKYENSEWKEVQHQKLQGELGWTAEAYPIPTDGFSDCVINWKWLYGELTPGQYRIIKDIINFRGTGDYDEYFLAAEFEIE